MQVGSFLGSLAVVVATYAITRDRRLTLAALVAPKPPLGEGADECGRYWSRIDEPLD